MAYNPFSLAGKTILVTGASSGIGQGAAVACSRMGARLVVNGRNEERLAETLSRMEGEGHRAIAADIATQEGLDFLVAEAPALDGVLHCAGISKICNVKRISRTLLEEIVAINEMAPILLTAGLLKAKKLTRGASVVLVASVSGVFIGSEVGESPYSATKGGLSGFSKSAARELAGQGIRVNTICPAVVQTELLGLAKTLFSEEQMAAQVAAYPLGRFGTVDDIAAAAIYLLSDASSWVTGIDLAVDGGFHL